MKKVISSNGNSAGPAGSQVCLRVDTGANTRFAKTATSLVPAGGGEAAMEGVNLSGFLSQATPYEAWRAPIHPKLRLAALASGPILLLCSPVLIAMLVNSAVPALVGALQVGEPEAWILGILCALLSLLTVLDLAGLIVYIPMLVFTDNLREGRSDWQWVAFGEAVLGAIHGFVIAMGLGIIVVVAVIGVVIACLCAIAVVVGLLGMAAGSSS